MDFSWWSKLRYEVKNSSPLLLSYGVIQGGIYKHPATPPLAERGVMRIKEDYKLT